MSMSAKEYSKKYNGAELLFTTKKSSKSNAEYSVCATDAQFHTFCCQNNFTWLVFIYFFCNICFIVIFVVLFNNTFQCGSEQWIPSGLVTFFGRNTCCRSFVEFLMRNRELQFIHLSIGEFCWNWTFLEQVTQL